MPTAVKERILNLITDAHRKYFEITQFFLDPSMSRSAKELKAYHFLQNEILHLDSDFSDFPTEMLINWQFGCRNKIKHNACITKST